MSSHVPARVMSHMQRVLLSPLAAQAADRSVRAIDLHAATTDRSGLHSITPIDMSQPQLRRARIHTDRREEVTDRLAALTDRAVLCRRQLEQPIGPCVRSICTQLHPIGQACVAPHRSIWYS